ncbi:hypothetical protein VW35_02490 [Devosia soli]|uniref:Uncharacterized protein n=1 Tax=Devosia soli TaxID=361041 RepID=A0A0F5LFJ2_9HYPH|nr:hypothetical protein [Devosia soli]KKB81055.1 hypothetical protein VW35_02490 [Devosia soli]
MRLTQRQLEILRYNETLSVSTITQNVWGHIGNSAVKVNRKTFDALIKAGMYLPHAQSQLTVVYSRTIAGRAALSQGEKP